MKFIADGLRKMTVWVGKEIDVPVNEEPKQVAERVRDGDLDLIPLDKIEIKNPYGVSLLYQDY